MSDQYKPELKPIEYNVDEMYDNIPKAVALAVKGALKHIIKTDFTIENMRDWVKMNNCLLLNINGKLWYAMLPDKMKTFEFRTSQLKEKLTKIGELNNDSKTKSRGKSKKK